MGLSRRRCRQRGARGYVRVFSMLGGARADFGRQRLLQYCIKISEFSAVGRRVPYRALNRRKLLVINGIEKLGLLIYFEERTSGGRFRSSTSSSGITCCRSLRRRRLVRQDRKEAFMMTSAHFVKRRSCSEYP